MSASSSVNELPPALREPVNRWLEDLGRRHGADAQQLPPLSPEVLRLVATSEYAARVLLDRWDEAAAIEQSMSRFAAGNAEPDGAPPLPGSERGAFMRELRRYRHRNLLRVLWHSVNRDAAVELTLNALSRLAERCISLAVRQATIEVERRHGRVIGDDGPMQPIVVAMGKLGGAELNFSSDIDLVFLYPDEGESDGRKIISAHEYFGRVSRETTALLDTVSADGFVYRVDTRLRPFGQSGPPVMSLGAFESYLLEHGRDWERYAWIKGRPVGDFSAKKDRQRLQDIVYPFVYRRYLDYGVFESLREMHAMIEAEVRRRDMGDNIKLGPGGIREVEFVVQSLQLVRGGNTPALQTTSLETALLAAIDDREMSADNAQALLRAYRLLRRIENALQAIQDRQLHSLPTDEIDRERIALALGYAGWSSLAVDLDNARECISRQFHAIGIREDQADDVPAASPDIEALWSARVDEARWQTALESLGLSDAGALAGILVDFRRRPEVGRIDAVSARRLRRFVARALAVLDRAADPVAGMQRLFVVAQNVLRRSAYIALLNENPAVLERLVDLCSRSTYLTATLAKHPALLDELIDSRLFERAPTAEEIAGDLRRRLRRADSEDDEARLLALSRFKQIAQFRVAVADFSDTLPIMKVSDRLTDIAELVLQHALDIATAQLVGQFGHPTCNDGSLRQAEFGVIAYGKFAGYEMSYGSDLDLVFVHDSSGDRQVTDGGQSIENAVYFSRLARRVVSLLSAQTESGVLYEVDTRLRPSGRAGLLVSSMDAFARYQRDAAWTWERQALLRSRAVAGSDSIASSFASIRTEVLTRRSDTASLAADVTEMRAKMRANLDRSTAEFFDLKHGRGGIGDIEFVVQYCVLRHASRYPAVIEYPDNIRQLDALAANGVLAAETAERMQTVYREFRAVAHRLSLDDQPAQVREQDFREARAFVNQQWQCLLGTAAP